jgi:hypothetical protein
MLYIVGTVASVLSVVTTHSILGASDHLTKISDHESQMIQRAQFVLSVGLARATIPAVALFIPAALLDMFDVVGPDSSTSTLSVMPMVLQEMVMVIWLIVEGFNPVTSEPATMNARELKASTAS